MSQVKCCRHMILIAQSHHCHKQARPQTHNHTITRAHTQTRRHRDTETQRHRDTDTPKYRRRPSSEIVHSDPCVLLAPADTGVAQYVGMHSLKQLTLVCGAPFPDTIVPKHKRIHMPSQPFFSGEVPLHRELLPVCCAESYSRSVAPRATPGLLHRQLLPVCCTESYPRSVAPRATPGLFLAFRHPGMLGGRAVPPQRPKTKTKQAVILP